MKFVCALGLSLACAAGFAGSVSAGEELGAQPGSIGSDHGIGNAEEQEYRNVRVSADSGIIRMEDDGKMHEPRAAQIPVWSEVIEIDDADWVRLEFGAVTLARSTQDARESYIRVSSLEDGYEQYLDAQSLEEWSNTTAYFNGGAVLVELMVSPNASDQINRVWVNGVQASDPVSERSICFGVDDRQLSQDPRDARLMPVGCTVWMFGEHGSCFLTAAHCGVSSNQVVQFNVPLSSNSGGTRNPPPQDQYAVDSSSIQSSSSIFIGNDWSFFGTFDNSTTGLTPLQAQGASHTLATSLPPNDGRPIRITGYGSTSSPVPPSWYLVQKTHVGPLVSTSNNVIRYQTDTSGGNSGGVVLDENNNIAFGIHTNAGCGNSGGSNQGTSLFNSGLQNALANPQGICLPRSIQASLLFEPTHVSPEGGDVVTLVIDNLQGHSIVGSPTMFVDSGSGFVGTTMTPSGGNFEGAFSAVDCGTPLSYYFSIEDEEGTVVTIPEGGASVPFRTVALDGLTVALEDNFETDMDWLSYTTGASGSWFRTFPADHDLGDPPSDADGSGRCFVTSNNNGIDVDNGSVFLQSPPIDLSSIDSPVLRMSLWMVGSPGDSLTVSFTNNFGISWVEVDSFVNTNGWIDVEYTIADYVDLTAAFYTRIEAHDGGADTTVEGGVDAFRIASEVCDNACEADLNGDGNLDFFDVSDFLNAFGAQNPVADFNGDGSYDFFDVSAFLNAFNAGCP
jgi:V8-like Glu-specific endopeptidase